MRRHSWRSTPCRQYTSAATNLSVRLGSFIPNLCVERAQFIISVLLRAGMSHLKVQASMISPMFSTGSLQQNMVSELNTLLVLAIIHPTGMLSQRHLLHMAGVFCFSGTGVLPSAVPHAIEALHSPSPALRRLSVRQLGRALQVHCCTGSHCPPSTAGF